MEKQQKRYRRAFALLGGFTPLKTDCGVLCEKRCCGGDEKTGMLLFPGEETTLPVREEHGRRLAVCGGHCNRNERPLACRLFPLFPVIDARGRMTASVDDRGGICPLVQHASEVRFSARFRHRVARVGKLLFRYADSRAFLEDVWREMEETRQVRDTFLPVEEKT